MIQYLLINEIENLKKHLLRNTFTSREASRFASDGFIPFPTCQITASGSCVVNGHSPHKSSYHTVLQHK